ncbi:MAG: sulfotransferase domain-containing protein [Proteobacteria bacterium]|nr:sulfotransferase domain-containing protein [Pseudomonadota bacterium]
MTKTCWLASYPKSGNTWMRIMIGCLALPEGAPVDINALEGQGGITSARGMFDGFFLTDSSLLSHDEIDRLRPRLYEAMASDLTEDEDAGRLPVRFVKAHDAYTNNADGIPLLAGARGAAGAIVIVRDPRDIVASLASHLDCSLDEAIGFMNSPAAAFCGGLNQVQPQLRQKLLRWHEHAESWLEQRDIPIHLVRYEELKRAPVEVFVRAMRFAGVEVSAEAARSVVARTSFASLQDQEQARGFAERLRGKEGRNFFRRGEAGAWRRELSVDQIAEVERAHGVMMSRLGYLPLR